MLAILVDMDTKPADAKFVDTHSHIHFKNYPFDPDETWAQARSAGIEKMIVVGCDLESSINAINFAQKYDDVYAAVAIHPHEASRFLLRPDLAVTFEDLLKNRTRNKIVAIGEFGLDYFYEHSAKSDQMKLLRWHLDLVHQYKLPVCLHVRDAFADFWPIFDEYHFKEPIKGVAHSFTGTKQELTEVLERGLHVALNGIMTFTRDLDQLEMAKTVPLDRLLLETDAPYLTPKPFRGKICKPEHTVLTAKFLAELRGEPIEVLANATTQNSITLFNLK